MSVADPLSEREPQPDIVVVGGGIVGLCCALALQRRGRRVLLIDRDEPCEQASRWNAGVWATSSLVPLANPGLPPRLAGLLLGRTPGFRLDPHALPSLTNWGLRFLRSCREGPFARGTAALAALISASRAAHEVLLAEAGATDLRRREGWLHLHRTPDGLAAARKLGPLYERHGVEHEVLDATAVRACEPSLAPLYAGGLLFRGSAAILDPGALARSYLGLFLHRGGSVLRAEVRAIVPEEGAWQVRSADGGTRRARDVVISAGPWSPGLLRPLGVRLPMMVERGTMRRFALGAGTALERPVFDAAAGIVLSPRPGGVQVSSGTFLTRPESRATSPQWERAERDARAVLRLGSALDGGPVTADRPTLPDCLPAIGAVPGRDGLWLCCGHQHVGFSTSAGSGELLAAAICGTPADPALADKATAFAPDRFL